MTSVFKIPLIAVLTKHTSQEVPWVLIGADLRVDECSEGWQKLGLPAGAGERVDRILPGSDVALRVLDVLASGNAMENVAIRAGSGEGERFFTAGYYPSPSTGKPRRVLLKAWPMEAQVMLDGATGQALSMNEAARAEFGRGGAAASQTDLALATQNGSHYLGKFTHRRPDGQQVELESILIALDD
jgi:hypothetical protein